MKRERNCLLGTKKTGKSLNSFCKTLGIVSIYVKHENNIVVDTINHGKEAYAPLVIQKEVRRIMNRDREFITSVLARYYNTRKLERMFILESEIDKLEQEFYNNYAWCVVRDWTKERNR